VWLYPSPLMAGNPAQLSRLRHAANPRAPIYEREALPLVCRRPAVRRRRTNAGCQQRTAALPLFKVTEERTLIGRLVVKLRMVFIARALALLWAVFWLFFFVVESLVWRTPALVMASWASVGLLFVILALLPWRKEGTGGLLLVVAGLLIGVAYVIWAPPGLPLASRVITTVVFSGPPVVAGILFLRHHRAVTAGV